MDLQLHNHGPAAPWYNRTNLKQSKKLRKLALEQTSLYSAILIFGSQILLKFFMETFVILKI